MRALNTIPKLELARAFALTVHANQPYGDKSYEDGHLNVVEGILVDAGMDSDEDRIIAKLHDSIEDITEALRIMAHDFVKDNFSDHVFDSVWAVTGIGATRVERNACAYAKIGQYPRAANYKISDRIGNMESARLAKPHLFAMYQREDAAFTENVVQHGTNRILIARYRAIATSPSYSHD